MAERETFVMFNEWCASIEELPEEKQAPVFRALFKFRATGQIPENASPEVRMFLRSILFSANKADENYDKKREVNSENGKKGGAPAGNQNAKKQQPGFEGNNPKQPKSTQNKHNVNANANANAFNPQEEISDIKKLCVGTPTQVFQPPTFPEVNNFCLKRKNGIDAESFIAYYAARGWIVDGHPVQNWHALVIRWEKNKHNPASSGRGGGTSPPKSKTAAEQQAEIEALQKTSKGVVC